MARQRWWIEVALYGIGRDRRFTQDSPILPDVWSCYLEDPDARSDLLIEPWRDTQPFKIAGALKHLPTEAGTTYNRSTVVAFLSLADLIKVVLPMAGWYTALWRVTPSNGRAPDESAARRHPRRLPESFEMWEDVFPGQGSSYPQPRLLSMVRIVGLLAHVARHGTGTIEEKISRLKECRDASGSREVRDSLANDMLLAFGSIVGERWPEPTPEDLVYTVNRNRTGFLALEHSVKTVKADAAKHLFSVNCSKRVWAIVDSGIDARHPAFLESLDTKPAAKGPDNVLSRSRIKETYDFSHLRELLLGENLAALRPEHRAGMRGTEDERNRFDELRIRLSRGRAIDWELLRPFLRVPHDETYTAPTNGHGTHVAGILGANWDRAGDETMVGVCPDIRMIDIRIMKEDGSASEFVIASALQFLRHLNSAADKMAVHGVNMSLSLLHDAANYACGQTPVCEEAERTVASGIVVVVAAGNHGYRRYASEDNGYFDQFCPVSITDPGNAEGVITVGSTHRIQPHTYGVSYFSSRGPTGDGRAKPDLVAPGEKIFAPTLNNSALRLDGTSMAAPHVSGAAAMLMSRHTELIGKPDMVKRILCATATDLGRERYFQGHGLVDVLRALQSV